MSAFNVNDLATVRLTDYGRQVLDKHINDELSNLARRFKRTFPETWQEEVDKFAAHFQSELAVSADGSVMNQFWSLMHVFRGEFHMGSPGVFVGGEIRIEADQ